MGLVVPKDWVPRGAKFSTRGRERVLISWGQMFL